MSRDRRRYPRVAVEMNLAFEAEGILREAKAVDLGPYGLKVVLPANSIAFPPGTRIELRLDIPNGDPISLAASVVRTDSDGIALSFTNPGALPFARLKDLVDSLLQKLSDDSTPLDLRTKVAKDRRKSFRVNAELDVAFEGEQPYGWRGSNIVNLSPYGMKVTLPSTAIQPAWGTPVRLRLATLDGQPPIAVKAIVWRREPNALALLLVDVGPRELERLKALVEVLQVHGRRRPMVPASV